MDDRTISSTRPATATGCAAMLSTTAYVCRCGRSTPSNSLSVYTPVTETEVAGWLRRYSVGELLACQPIEAGIENTNYYVTTTQGRYVLTLFERLPAHELAFHAEQRFPDLPRGPVHADLFRDNALFESGRISGVIDFYFAGGDCLLYDVAVCANDWCLVELQSDAALDAARTEALLRAYEAVRPLSDLERAAWPVMLRAAALRFWL